MVKGMLLLTVAIALEAPYATGTSLCTDQIALVQRHVSLVQSGLNAEDIDMEIASGNRQLNNTPSTCHCLRCGSVQAVSWQDVTCPAASSVAGKACKLTSEAPGCYSSSDDFNCECPGTIGERLKVEGIFDGSGVIVDEPEFTSDLFIDFSKVKVVQNNLGNLGPDTGEPVIIYEGIGSLPNGHMTRP